MHNAAKLTRKAHRHQNCDKATPEENSKLAQGLSLAPQEVSGEIWFITLCQFPTVQILVSSLAIKTFCSRTHAKDTARVQGLTKLNEICRPTKVARELWRSIAHRRMGLSRCFHLLRGSSTTHHANRCAPSRTQTMLNPRMPTNQSTNERAEAQPHK